MIVSWRRTETFLEHCEAGAFGEEWLSVTGDNAHEHPPEADDLDQLHCELTGARLGEDFNVDYLSCLLARTHLAMETFPSSAALSTTSCRPASRPSSPPPAPSPSGSRTGLS